jgi:hypothetical protein
VTPRNASPPRQRCCNVTVVEVNHAGG